MCGVIGSYFGPHAAYIRHDFIYALGHRIWRRIITCGARPPRMSFIAP